MEQETKYASLFLLLLPEKGCYDTCNGHSGVIDYNLEKTVAGAATKLQGN